MHPHRDYVKMDGSVNDPAAAAKRKSNSKAVAFAAGVENGGGQGAQSGQANKLIGTVYSVMKDYVRVGFETPIDGIETGKWRYVISLHIGIASVTAQFCMAVTCEVSRE